MKLAALGDIHSNRHALNACLEYIYSNGYDGIVFLGDYVSDCAYPQKTMDILLNIPERYKTWFIRGNREDYMLDHRMKLSEEWSYNSQSGSLKYTFENLRSSDLRFFESMPIGMEIRIDGYPVFTVCHGTLRSSSELALPGSEIMETLLDDMGTSLLVCAHSHTPFVYKRRGKTAVNGGTVGMSVNGQNCAQFISLTSDGGEWQYEQISVPYDYEATVRDIKESGLADKADVWARTIIGMLKTGRHYNKECIDIVRRLCDERDLPFDTEELWQEAAKELGI